MLGLPKNSLQATGPRDKWLYITNSIIGINEKEHPLMKNYLVSIANSFKEEDAGNHRYVIGPNHFTRIFRDLCHLENFERVEKMDRYVRICNVRQRRNSRWLSASALLF